METKQTGSEGSLAGTFHFCERVKEFFASPWDQESQGEGGWMFGYHKFSNAFEHFTLAGSWMFF